MWQTLLMDTQEQGRARMRVRLDGAWLPWPRRDAFDAEHVREAYRACYRTCTPSARRIRTCPSTSRWLSSSGTLKKGCWQELPEDTVAEITDAYCDSFYVFPPRVHEEAEEVLRQVKSDGYRVGLISNTGMTPGYAFRIFLEQKGLAAYFDTMAFSDEMLLAKPSVPMFERTLGDLGAEPSETVHVGDHLRNDVLGAKEAGLHTIWIETHDDRREPVEVSPDITVKTLGEVADGVRRLASHAG